MTTRSLTETEKKFTGLIRDWKQTNWKPDIMQEVWGDQIPDYLYYGIEPGQPTEFDTATLVGMFFNEEDAPRFGDIEVGNGKPWTFGGNPYIRIRNPRRAPMMIEASGSTFNLIQIGHASGDSRCVNFFLLATHETH